MRTANARKAAVLISLMMVAFNLRIVLTSLPVVIDDIDSALHWSNAWLGDLTSLPVLAMGVFALLVPRIGRRLGRERAVAFGLALIALSLILRLWGEHGPVLVASVAISGIGIAIAGGLVPSVVREEAPDQAGLATGLWTAAMLLGAAAGSALTVPLSSALGSWQHALAIWAIPALVGLAAWWWVQLRGRDHDVARRERQDSPRAGIRDLPWRSPVAWGITGYLLLNSIVFYTLMAWLPKSYDERGWTNADGGNILAIITVAEIVAAIIAPPLADRLRSPRALLATTVAMEMVGLTVMGVAPGFLTIAMGALFGLGIGAGFACILTLLAESPADPPASARLTAMAFSVTYLIAAIGPTLAGGLLDLTGSWVLLYLALVATCLLRFVAIVPLRRGARVT